MKLIIDDHLDTITRFSEIPGYYGSKLSWFQNSGFRDIKLTYRGRLLKVYLKVNENDLFSIQQDAKLTLSDYLSNI
jgi:hypothetical protein